MELEEHGWVIDFLPRGRSNERMPEPCAQLVGDRYFTLFEVTIKPDVNLVFGQKVYIGRGERAEVDRIRKRITYEDLSPTSRSELETSLGKIVKSKEAEFVNFFNKAGPLSVRLHQLELLHGVGKKHLAQILDARDTKAFESFDDIRSRVQLLPDPVQLVSGRILEEMAGKPQHYLFVRPPRPGD